MLRDDQTAAAVCDGGGGGGAITKCWRIFSRIDR